MKFKDLCRVFVGETIHIPATDGRKTFSDAFPGKSKASDFGASRRVSKSTPKTEVAIYDALVSGKDFKYFHRLLKKKSPKELCLTEAQIAMFCRNRRRFLKKDEFTIFFYEEEGGNVGLAQVSFGDNLEHPDDRGWRFGPIDFDGESCFAGERIVVPVLNS